LARGNLFPLGTPNLAKLGYWDWPKKDWLIIIWELGLFLRVPFLPPKFWIKAFIEPIPKGRAIPRIIKSSRRELGKY